MLNFGLDGVLTSLKFVRDHIDVARGSIAAQNGTGELVPEYKDVVENNLQWVHKQAGQYLLSATDDRMARIWGMWQGRVTYVDIYLQLTPLLEALEDDLRKERSFIIHGINRFW
jgi:hypothetical protein